MQEFKPITNFQRLFTAVAVSNIGDGLVLVGLPWISLLITDSAMWMALVAFFYKFPNVIFAPIAGVLGDHYDKRRLMIASDMARLALTGLLCTTFLAWERLWISAENTVYSIILCGISFLLGCAEVTRANLTVAIIPAIVEQDQLEKANARIWVAERLVGMTLAPILAGALITVDPVLPLFVAAFTYLVAAIFITSVQTVLSPLRHIQTFSTEAILVAGRWLFNQQELRRLSIFLGLHNIAMFSALVMLPLFTQEVLKLGPLGYSLIMATYAAGGVLGALVGPILVRCVGNEVIMHLSVVSFALTMAVVANSDQPKICAFGLAANMFTIICWNTVTVSFRQRIVPPEMLSRVNSLYRMLAWGGIPIGSLLGGWLVTIAENQGLSPETALRVPFKFAVIMLSIQAIYALLYLRLPDEYRIAGACRFSQLRKSSDLMP